MDQFMSTRFATMIVASVVSLQTGAAGGKRRRRSGGRGCGGVSFDNEESMGAIVASMLLQSAFALAAAYAASEVLPLSEKSSGRTESISYSPPDLEEKTSLSKSSDTHATDEETREEDEETRVEDDSYSSDDESCFYIGENEGLLVSESVCESDISFTDDESYISLTDSEVESSSHEDEIFCEDVGVPMQKDTLNLLLRQEFNLKRACDHVPALKPCDSNGTLLTSASSSGFLDGMVTVKKIDDVLPRQNATWQIIE